MAEFNIENQRYKDNRKKIDDKKLKKLLEAGWTDKQIADFFEVGLRTLVRWKAEVKGFKVLIDTHRRPSNARVERSLYERATGYIVREIKVHTDKLGNVETTEIIKELPPDATAMIYWLKNRERMRWRDKIEIGGDGLQITVSRKEYTRESLPLKEKKKPKELPKAKGKKKSKA